MNNTLKYNFSYFVIPDSIYHFTYENYNDLQITNDEVLLKRNINKDFNFDNTLIKMERNINYQTDIINNNISFNKNYYKKRKINIKNNLFKKIIIDKNIYYNKIISNIFKNKKNYTTTSQTKFSYFMENINQYNKEIFNKKKNILNKKDLTYNRNLSYDDNYFQLKYNIKNIKPNKLDILCHYKKRYIFSNNGIFKNIYKNKFINNNKTKFVKIENKNNKYSVYTNDNKIILDRNTKNIYEQKNSVKLKKITYNSSTLKNILFNKYSSKKININNLPYYIKKYDKIFNMKDNNLKLNKISSKEISKLKKILINKDFNKKIKLFNNLSYKNNKNTSFKNTNNAQNYYNTKKINYKQILLNTKIYNDIKKIKQKKIRDYNQFQSYPYIKRNSRCPITNIDYKNKGFIFINNSIYINTINNVVQINKISVYKVFSEIYNKNFGIIKNQNKKILNSFKNIAFMQNISRRKIKNINNYNILKKENNYQIYNEKIKKQLLNNNFYRTILVKKNEKFNINSIVGGNIYNTIKGSLLEGKQNKKIFLQIDNEKIKKNIKNKIFIDKNILFNSSKKYDKKINIEKNIRLTSTSGYDKNIEINKEFLLDNKIIKINYKLNIDKNILLEKYMKNNINIIINNKLLKKNLSKQINIEKDILIKNNNQKDLSIKNNNKYINNITRIIKTEPPQINLELYKTLWFIKGIGETDLKILPNIDYNYPALIDIFVEKPDYTYIFEYENTFKEFLDDNYIVELYNYDYNLISTLSVPKVEILETNNDIINLKIEKDNTEENRFKFTIKIVYPELNYIIIRQPVNEYMTAVLYTVTQKFLGENKHPIPFGNDLGIREIPIHINIMVEFINMLLLIWQHRFLAFSGQVGIHAIYGLVNLVYEWLTLETSQSAEYIQEYYRCFRWLRWEAEKVYNIAKADPKLNGNKWINFVINEMIDYIEMHHIDVIPILEDIRNTDDWRNWFTDPTFDIKFMLDKFKGERKRLSDNNYRLTSAKSI